MHLTERDEGEGAGGDGLDGVSDVEEEDPIEADECHAPHGGEHAEAGARKTEDADGGEIAGDHEDDACMIEL